MSYQNSIEADEQKKAGKVETLNPVICAIDMKTRTGGEEGKTPVTPRLVIQIMARGEKSYELSSQVKKR